MTAVDVDIDKNGVYRYLGYGNHNPSPFISSLIDSCMIRACNLLKPAYTYTTKAIERVSESKVLVSSAFVLNSRTISYVLSDCKQVIIYLATIGRGVEEESSKLAEEGEMLDATIWDAIGSEAVEKTACKLQSDIEEIARSGEYQTTLRYSPGYCDWDITEQKAIFQMVDSTALGVSLTDSCLMIPRKSTSGIMGVGKFDKTKPSPCSVCNRRAHCTYKRTRL